MGIQLCPRNMHALLFYYVWQSRCRGYFCRVSASYKSFISLWIYSMKWGNNFLAQMLLHKSLFSLYVHYNIFVHCIAFRIKWKIAWQLCFRSDLILCSVRSHYCASVPHCYCVRCAWNAERVKLEVLSLSNFAIKNCNNYYCRAKCKVLIRRIPET